MAATGGSSASESGALRAAGSGGGRTYGSTAPATHQNRGPGQRHLEHRPRSGDTLPGLALRYGVTTEQIKRANRLYTNDSIFLKESIQIPALKLLSLPNGMKAMPGRVPVTGASAPEVTDKRLSPDLSPADFLKRLDCKITRSKAAAIRNLADGAVRFPSSAEGHSSGWDPAQAQRRASAQRARLGPVPLTRNTRVTTLRQTEDEIFDL